MSLRNLAAAGLSVAALSLGFAWAGTVAAKDVSIKEMRGARLVEYAAAPYVQFREDIDRVSGSVPADAEAMRDVHRRLASHDNRTMAGAWVAYAAMVAADTPAFAREIERRSQNGRSKRAFLEELEMNPAIVRNIPGSEEAVAQIMAFATNDAARIRNIGDNFIASAYDLQKTAWARREIALAGMERVDNALQFAARRAWTDYSDRGVRTSRGGTVQPNLASHESWSAEWSNVKAPVNAGARPGVIVTKALVLAAHYAMNTAEQEHLAAYGTSKRSERCFTSAKMNLNQCIAATRTPYEEAFCLGQHALNDMSACVGWPAGAGGAGS